MRLILVGAGRVGLAVMETGLAAGDRITLVENDPARVARARMRFGAISVVEGDATSEGVLREAGAPDVDAIVVATPDDPTNLMVAALGRGMGVKNVVCRVNDDEATPLFAEAGASPVRNPSHLAAEHLYHAFEAPIVRAFMPVGEDAEIVTLVLSARSRLANVSVQDAVLPHESLLLAVNRGGKVIVPTADLVLKPGDVLTLVARTRLLESIVGSIAGNPGRRFAGRLRGLFGRR